MLPKLFETKFAHTAANMTFGNFGGQTTQGLGSGAAAGAAEYMLICTQSMDGILSVYDQVRSPLP